MGDALHVAGGAAHDVKVPVLLPRVALHGLRVLLCDRLKQCGQKHKYRTPTSLNAPDQTTSQV